MRDAAIRDFDREPGEVRRDENHAPSHTAMKSTGSKIRATPIRSALVVVLSQRRRVSQARGERD